MRGAAWPLRAPMLLLFCQIQRQITLHTRHSGGHVLAAVNDGLGILLCLCSFSMPVFASGTDPAPEPLPEITEEEPTTGGMEPEGVSITPKGNATLVDDFYGDKQLITVTTKAGNYFYILIDRANEDKETSVHFLNQVDDADLLALLDEERSRASIPKRQAKPMMQRCFWQIREASTSITG